MDSFEIMLTGRVRLSTEYFIFFYLDKNKNINRIKMYISHKESVIPPKIPLLPI